MPHAMLRLVENEDAPVVRLTGEQVLRKVADVIEPHLPGLSLDDPLRGALASIMHAAPRQRVERETSARGPEGG